MEGVARPVSHWLRTARDARSAALDTAEAVAAARASGVATLILPADAGWEASLGPVAALPLAALPDVPTRRSRPRPAALRAPGAALLLGGVATSARGLDLAARIAAATGASLLRDTFAPRLARGGGRPRPVGVPYLTEMAVDALRGLSSLVLVDTRRPVGFFAYPGQPSLLADPATVQTVLAAPGEDALGALEALAAAVGAPASVAVDAVGAGGAADRAAR